MFCCLGSQECVAWARTLRSSHQISQTIHWLITLKDMCEASLMELQTDCKDIFQIHMRIKSKEMELSCDFWDWMTQAGTQIFWHSCWISWCSHGFVTLKDSCEVFLVDALKKDKHLFWALIHLEPKKKENVLLFWQSGLCCLDTCFEVFSSNFTDNSLVDHIERHV